MSCDVAICFKLLLNKKLIYIYIYIQSLDNYINTIFNSEIEKNYLNRKDVQKIQYQVCQFQFIYFFYYLIGPDKESASRHCPIYLYIKI